MKPNQKMKLMLSLLLCFVLFNAAFSEKRFTIGNAELEIGGDINLTIRRDGNSKLKSKLILPGNQKEPIEICSTNEDQLCLKWGNSVKLNLEKDNETCLIGNIELLDAQSYSYCIDYEDFQWYGGPERWGPAWPVQHLNIDHEPYIVRDDNFQGVSEPYWLNSQGTTVYVSPESPLFIDSNTQMDNFLCFILIKNSPPYEVREHNILQFEICENPDPVQGHRFAIDKYLGKPSDIPDETMIKYPVYSTWAKYKQDINDQKVLEYARSIVDHNFPISQVEIDDKWEPCYGSWTFDEKKFPSIKDVTDELHRLGARVTLWVYPFINEDCEPHFTNAKNDGKFVINGQGEYLSNWWNGRAASVDFTNDTTAAWWAKRTRDMMEAAGIDSLKFDAGESSWVPQLPVFNVDTTIYPNIYTKKYIETASTFGKFIEVRVGKQTQELPIFVRMLDKDSRWGLDNGLKALLATVFQFNINGYPFVLPDMVGGNVYGSDQVSKELFIRWLQVNTFLPSVQFSVVPWDFDDETVDISRKFVNLRTESASLILEAARQSVIDGTPLNAPIWWIAPDDPEAQKCSDEYLLGETLLVAPILEDGARQRDIYLPSGNWADLNRPSDEVIVGPQWLRNYAAALDELPYFRRLD